MFGVEGSIEPGDVLLIDLSHSDLKPTLFGVPVESDIGFDTEITFQHIAQGAIAKWELCLLDKEVNPVLDALFQQGLQPSSTNLNAIHNHYLRVQPEVKFVHSTLYRQWG